MALATREVELVIIARDRASSTLARIGGAFAVMGAGVARVGTRGIRFFAGLTDEAIEFRREVALAFTQVSIAGAEFDDVLNIVRTTLRQTGRDVQEVTDFTYDIFSTLDIQNMQEAEQILMAVAQAADAGQAPMRDVGRAAIAWINALGEAPTVENMSRILDTQFALVRMGAGTYGEFASSVGKAIPAFAAANQGVEELSATVAFLTRNGLSASEASTSAARAIELLFSPKAIGGLRRVGIEVEDGTGKFRKMDDLLADVVEHFRGLSDAEQKLEFQEIFGAGRIQARRFFDVLLNEGKFEDLLMFMDATRNSAGAVAEGFDIMTAEPAVQLDFLRNRFVVLRQEIGDVFIPFLVNRLFPVMDRFLKWWEGLDDIMRENAVQWAAFATLAFTISGVVASALGIAVLFLGAMKLLTGSFAAAIAVGGGIVGLIFGIGAAIALAILDWEKFVEIFGPWWDRAVGIMQPVVDWFKREFPEGMQWAEDAFQGFINYIEEIDWEKVWEGILEAVQNFVDFFVRIWEDEVMPRWEGFAEFISEKVDWIIESVEKLVGSEGFGMIPDAVGEMLEDIEPILGELAALVRTTLELIVTIIGFNLESAATIWETFGTRIVRFVRITFGVVAGIIEGVLKIIRGILDFFIFLFTGEWDRLWESVKAIVSGAWDIITSIVSGAIENILNIFDLDLPNIETIWENFWKGLKSKVEEWVPKIMKVINPLPSLLWQLSPWTKGSPSLVEDVRSGLAALTQSYRTELQGLERMTRRITPSVHMSLSEGLALSPGLAFTQSVGRQSHGAGTRIDTSIDRQVNVDKVISQADPMEIASAIAWRELNS